MSEWISVKDRLPEKDGKYLTSWFLSSGDAVYEIVLFMKDVSKQPMLEDEHHPGWVYYDAEYDEYEWLEWFDGIIKYWMPLPEPPEKEEE